ncbi:MAG: PAS domain-containing protein [Thermoplasmata archaeon]|nr:PAS domain-containing protein [Thermoplasmata archaeon]
MYTIYMAKYSTISVPKELHDELQYMVKERPELGYSSIAEFCKEAIRVHVSNIRMERREAFIQQIDLPGLLKEIELVSRTKGGEYRTVFESLMDCAFVVSPDGTISNCNDELADHLGYPNKEEILGNDMSILFMDEDEMNQMMDYVASNGHIKSHAIKMVRKDGKPLDFLLTMGAIESEGKLMGYVGTGKDITVRKMVEARLKKERDLFSKVLDGMYDSVIIHQDGKIKFAAGRCDALGYSPSEIEGINIQDLIAPEDRERAEEITANRIGGKDVSPIQTYNVISKDGEKRKIEVSTRVIDYEGRPASLSVIRYPAKPC